MRAILALPVLLACVACNEQGTASRTPQPSGRDEAAKSLADASLQQRLRSQGTQQRGVQVFQQALPGMVAVCGRSTMTSGTGAPYVPYVAVVSFEGEAPRVTTLSLGETGPEASRVFMEMTDRCFEGGGPANARAMARSYPPLPTGAMPQREPEQQAEPAAETQAEAPRANGTVTISSRSGANLRTAARGGDVIRTLPASSTYDLITEAPGGWVQVGERGAPIGWVHNSVLEARAR
ncbi:SH3 domain-containing protein [Rhodovarius crocodyli]|uniref:SH3 domain-containing protein n=1 Tax=Rhodovarius crocodyli TaxID=1979269 RepID=A0A437MH72_9PROT|nr:SH3 domain-containing protein [Rhodovarius crocodyli]RVT96981.1 SH3 domain-containing protein [Rhodovarius crocodyli]